LVSRFGLRPHIAHPRYQLDFIQLRLPRFAFVVTFVCTFGVCTVYTRYTLPGFTRVYTLPLCTLVQFVFVSHTFMPRLVSFTFAFFLVSPSHWFGLRGCPYYRLRLWLDSLVGFTPTRSGWFYGLRRSHPTHYKFTTPPPLHPTVCIRARGWVLPVPPHWFAVHQRVLPGWFGFKRTVRFVYKLQFHTVQVARVTVTHPSGYAVWFGSVQRCAATLVALMTLRHLMRRVFRAPPPRITTTPTSLNLAARV